jgi:hypothetical protein
VHGNQNGKLEGVGLLMEQDFVLANFSGGSENCILESGVHTRSLANKQVHLMVPNSSCTHSKHFQVFGVVSEWQYHSRVHPLRVGVHKPSRRNSYRFPLLAIKLGKSVQHLRGRVPSS